MRLICKKIKIAICVRIELWNFLEQPSKLNHGQGQRERENERGVMERESKKGDRERKRGEETERERKARYM